MSKYNDFYGRDVNYTRLFLLFLLFLVSLYFYLWKEAANYAMAEYEETKVIAYDRQSQIDNLLRQ